MIPVLCAHVFFVRHGEKRLRTRTPYMAVFNRDVSGKTLSKLGKSVIGSSCSAATKDGGTHMFSGIGELAEFGNTCLIKRTSYDDGLIDPRLQSCSPEAAPWLFDPDVVQAIETVEIAAIPHCAVTLKHGEDKLKYARFEDNLRTQSITRTMVYRKLKALYDALLIEYEEAKRIRKMRREERDEAQKKLNKLRVDKAEADAKQKGLEIAVAAAKRAAKEREDALVKLQVRIDDLNSNIGKQVDRNNTLKGQLSAARSGFDDESRLAAELQRGAEKALADKQAYTNQAAEYERLNNILKQDIVRARNALPKACSSFGLDNDLFHTCAAAKGRSAANETRKMIPNASAADCATACWKDRGCNSFYSAGASDGNACFLYSKTFGQGQTWRETTNPTGVTGNKKPPPQPGVHAGCEVGPPVFHCPKGTVITGGWFRYGRWIKGKQWCNGNKASNTKAPNQYGIPGVCLNRSTCAFGNLNATFGDPRKGVYKHWEGQVSCGEA